MALSTQNPGETPESIAISNELDAAKISLLQEQQVAYRVALEDASRRGFADGDAFIEAQSNPAVTRLNASIEQANKNIVNYEPVYGPTTYYSNGNEISLSEYQDLQLVQTTAEVNITGVQVGSIPADDPIVARQLTEEELEGEDIIAANIARTTPGTPEFEEAENEAIIAANIAAQDEAEAEELAQLEYEAALKEASAAQEEVDQENDWRVRLHLADDANYLYGAGKPGILAPLRETNGIIFPYTPTIQVQYNADYANYDLVHSNYRGYFYTGSQVQNVIITATFTANDVEEANYMLASLHFLKSCTKMFYGQDDLNRGMPPPVVFLTGLGEYQFNNHPCVVNSMHYNLPDDVDYIPCGKPDGLDPVPIPPNPNSASSAVRLASTDQVEAGGKPINASTRQGFANPYKKATYVPTKIDINFTMLPIQTRDQVSNEFSLEQYANGDLLRKGFW